MERLPGYDAYKLASPEDRDEDMRCSHCGGGIDCRPGEEAVDSKGKPLCPDCEEYTAECAACGLRLLKEDMERQYDPETGCLVYVLICTTCNDKRWQRKAG